jgi:predicted DNA-binding protein
MADTTYAVKVSNELKEKLQKLVDESGQSSKDFFSDMVS